MDDWASFRKKGKKYSEKLEVLKPDIVAKLNEEFRKEEERKREMEEKRKKQIDEDGENGFTMQNMMTITGLEREILLYTMILSLSHLLRKS